MDNPSSRIFPITTQNSASLLRLAEELGPHIAILEIAAECVDDWSSDVIEKLQSISSKHGFLLWEGSKIINPFVDFMGRADVPLETRRILEDLIKKSYTSGPLKSATWSNLAVPGPLQLQLVSKNRIC